MNKCRRALLYCCLLQALSAQADDNTYEQARKLLPLTLAELMAVKVSISTQTKQEVATAPSVITVITADDIRATGTANLMEILQSVPGIYVRANQFGFKPLISFRGAAGTHALLMVNGAPAKDLVWSPGIFWKGVPASAIERVEIIRGPGSALFGSDASAGVINVITKTAEGIAQSEAGVRIGSFDTRSGWLQHGTRWNGFDIGVTAEVSTTDGHRPRIGADAQAAQDARAGTHASLAPGRADFGWDNQDLRFSMARDNWRLLADYTHHSDIGVGLTGAGVLDPRTGASDTQYSLALLYDNANFARDWGLNAEVRYRDMEYSSGNGFYERPPGYQDTANPASAYPAGFINQMRSAERRMNFELSGLYTGVKGHALRLGGGYVWQDLYSVEQFLNKGLGPDGATLPAGGPLVDVSDSPYAFAPERARRIGYLFLQDVWSFAKDWEFTAGARYDRYSDFGGTLNPRLALVWQSTARLTTKLMYGQAFRAPSFLELYALTSATQPNPNLDPERSHTWDLAFSYAATPDLRLGMTLYHFAQSDLISLDATNRYQNMGDNTTRGVELEAHWQASETLRLSGNLTHRKQSNAFYSTASVPNEEAYLRADWTFHPKWNWNLQANWTGERPGPASDPRKPLRAHTLADTTLTYFHDKHWEFAASVRNLFDVDAWEYTGRSIPGHLPLPGRNLFAEIRYKF
jgi:iron complex outermembrane receptor protein